MPDPTQVSILKRDGTQNTYYETYEDARDVAVSGDVIQIWADISNEQIELLNGVDIWIAPGVEIKSGSSQTTIVAPTTGDLNCNIYGQGIIKNDTNGNCIFIDNEDAKLTIECDHIEGTGGSTSSVSVNIKKANKFYLSCNKVYNKDGQAIRIGEPLNPGLIQELNLQISKVETGNTSSSSTGTTAITTRGNGFLKIEEILCRNLGHCLSHREGEITARIKNLTTATRRTGNSAATVHIDQYQFGQVGTQKLILYFDEIKALSEGTGIVSNDGIQVREGTGIFIGRRVFSEDSAAIQIVQANTKGSVMCDEIISQSSVALTLNNFTNQITINANYIEGNESGGVIFCEGLSNFIIKNAKIVNNNGASPSRGIFLQPDINDDFPSVELNNVKVVSGNLDSGVIIYLNSTEEFPVNIKNFGLFANRSLESYIDLKVGTSSNYLFVESSELT